VRTTLTIDDDLLRALRAAARSAGIPLRRVVNQALRQGLEQLGKKRPRRRYRCPTFSMGSVASPGFDLDKALAMASALEDEEVARKFELRK
jgi:hypothetical protein